MLGDRGARGKANARRRILVIGLDGVTLDLVNPWIENLPNLKALRERGICSSLLSTYPPLTIPAWSSFMTGKSPGNHGIYEFFRRRSGSYDQVLNTFPDLREVTLWELLSSGGKRVGVVNVPFTYPPPRLARGFFVSGLLTPFGATDFSYPPAILKELEDRLGPYQLHHNSKRPQPVIDELYEVLQYRLKSALYLMREKEWDFFMVHFFGTDRVQHEFWHLCDRTHPQFAEQGFERYGNVILEFFKRIDTAVGELVTEAGNDTSIIVMSDHGFGKITKFFNVNLWLYKLGFLKFKRSVRARLKLALFKLGFTYLNVSQAVLMLNLTSKAMEMGQEGRQEFNRKMFLSFDDVDWSRTQAYSMGNYGQIFVNLKGREPQGIVDSVEKEALLGYIEKELRRVVDPEIGTPVVDRVLRREDVYAGKRVEESPDLMFMMRDMQYKAMGWADFPSSGLFNPVVGTTGHHRVDGLLIAKSPEIIKPNATPREARIEDLAPTLLYLSRLPVPEDMDGRVLLELFQDDFREANPVEYTASALTEQAPMESVYSEEEEAALKRHLRDLGYI